MTISGQHFFSLYQLMALVITFTALFSVLGERLHLPKVVGPMLVAVILSCAVVSLEAWGLDLGLAQLSLLVNQVDFSTLVMDGMLGLLLFAGAMHIPLKLLEQQAATVLGLAIVSTIVSTFLIGGLSWWLATHMDLNITFMQALVFGALISPTDPVAVMAVLKNARLPKRLEVIISGESLFNDGIGIVLFVILSAIVFGGEEATIGYSVSLLAQEVGGGLAIGLAVGGAAYYLLENAKEQATQVLITLAVATGGYALAQMFHASGALAMVVAGLLVGNFGLRETMDRSTRVTVDSFWTIVDDVLNAVLFVLVGIQVLLLPVWIGWGVAVLAVVVHLFGRAGGVLLSTLLLQPGHEKLDTVWRDSVSLLTWSGLRGGVSLALVLSLPAGDLKNTLIAMTYVVVVFSISVQGLTIGRLFRRQELRRISDRAKEMH
jgi:CPA1 family monovalent cation:H+ antiporter